MSKERQLEIANLEYLIRKKERGVKITHRDSFVITDDGTDHEIKRLVKEIKSLRDRLEKLTGSRSPSTPKWAV